jgi:hypothetical protein
MKNVKLTITGNQQGHHFDIFLKLTGWWDFCGKWSCLPGYLFDNGGYFEYISSGKFLGFYDREITTGEMVSVAWFGTKLDSVESLYMSLNDFADDVSVGNKGEGNIFAYGAKKKEFSDPALGFVKNDVRWEIVHIS